MTLCSTPESLCAALERLSERSHVFLDCEGQTLGKVGGKLSLLNLGVILEKDGKRILSIFLIDTLAFQGAKSRYLIPIFDILRSERIFKVVFDGRMDASELLHGHGVQLRNVLDMQVADILSREKRGESVEDRLGRLVGFLPNHEITRNRASYLQVQKLNSLESAMKEQGVASNGKGYVDHSRWLQRPFEKSALQYAAEDVYKICLLYEKFLREGYISPDTLVPKSASYIALHAKARPNGGDKYNQHGLLPLGLFTETASTSGIECRGCKRDLSLDAFPKSFSTHELRLCFVCRAVNTSGHVPFRNAHTYEDLDYDEGLDDMWDESFYDEGLDDMWGESFYDDDY